MRIRLLLALFAIVWIALLVRVYYLSIQSHHRYEELANRNTSKIELIAPVRGEISDRGGRPLAINKLGFKLQVRPHLSGPSKHEMLEEELRFIVERFPFLSYDKLEKRYVKQDSSYNHHFIDVVDFISYEEIVPLYSKLIMRENLKVVPSPKRYYPNGKTAAHLIGYVARATQSEIDEDPLLSLVGSKGKSGIEGYYNDYLQGVAGERLIKVSAYNEEMKQLSATPAIENQDLLLNLDLRLQERIAELFGKDAGAAVVMDVNGAIYAAGSYPEYDLNTFVSGISVKKWNRLMNDIDTPFTNKFINGLYPPGSTVKTGLGLIYVTTELSEWWSVDCNGTLPMGRRNFRCWKTHGHGKTSLVKAIRESCDDYFYKGSLKVGIAKMSEGLKRYGLGRKTGIDLPNEFIGTVPSRTWKREKYNQPWYIGETLNTSIGQGSFLSTPMQIAQFTALMATGKLPVPHVAMRVGGKAYDPEPVEVLNETEKKKLPIIRRAMYEVCNHAKGTATSHIRTRVKIAGKTGTAQVVGISQETKKRLQEHEMEYYQRSHAWLTTYGPYRHPQFIVTVLVEHGGHGGQAAGGIVSKIYDALEEFGYLK